MYFKSLLNDYTNKELERKFKAFFMNREQSTLSSGDISYKVNGEAINAIETGKFSPSPETAFRLSKLFGVAIEEIFELVH